jgi:hypothetical protein
MPDMPRKPRGFAALSAERRREIARQGGRAAQAQGTAHQFSHEEAVAAGQKGGKAAWRRGTAHRLTPADGSKGGKVAQARGTAHRLTPAEAKAAARKRKGWRKRKGQSS